MASILNTAHTTFESMFDLNVGLVKVIQKHYGKDAKHFNYGLLWLPDDDIAYEVLKQLTDNPLDWLLVPEYKSSAEDLYKELYNKYYSEIIQLSRPTSLYNLFSMFIRVGGGDVVNTAVTCKDEQQLQFIKKNCPLLDAHVKEYKDVDRESYGTIYINKFKTLSEFDRVVGKNIFLLNYRYNFEEDGTRLLKDYYDIYSKFNEIKVMDAFVDLHLCEG